MMRCDSRDLDGYDGGIMKHLYVITHRIHVWYICLHLVDFMVNVGKYTIHGSYGLQILVDIV